MTRRLLRALNIPGLLAVSAFVLAVCKLAASLDPYTLTGA